MPSGTPPIRRRGPQTFAVVAAGSVDLVNERAVALADAIVERDFTAVEDLDSVELLAAMISLESRQD